MRINATWSDRLVTNKEVIGNELPKTLAAITTRKLSVNNCNNMFYCNMTMQTYIIGDENAWYSSFY